MQLSEMTWPAVDALSRDIPIVVPIAALEQHGHHMPLFTDSLLLAEVVSSRPTRHAGASGVRAAVVARRTPLHHLDYPGTLSASSQTYVQLLTEVVENLLHHGFHRILLLSGHGGNSIPAQQAMFDMRQRHRGRNDLLLLSAVYWGLAEGQPESIMPLTQNQMGHACEWETSMMLRIRPELVGNIAEIQPLAFGKGFGAAHRAWTTRDRSPSGHIGYPREASAEKGEALFRAFTRDVVNLLERIIGWDGSGWEA